MNDKPLKNVTMTPDMEERLLRYCTIHGITKQDAVRRAIFDLLRWQRTDPPKLNPDVPL